MQTTEIPKLLSPTEPRTFALMSEIDKILISSRLGELNNIRFLLLNFFKFDFGRLCVDLNAVALRKVFNSAKERDYFISKYIYRRMCSRLGYFVAKENIHGSDMITLPHATLLIKQRLAKSGFLHQYLASVNSFRLERTDYRYFQVKELIFCPDHFGKWQDRDDVENAFSLRDKLKQLEFVNLGISTPNEVERIDTLRFDEDLGVRFVLMVGFLHQKDKSEDTRSPLSSGCIKDISNILAQYLVSELFAK